MLVVIQYGSRFGQVCDFGPTEARAMLADGRARLPTPRDLNASDPEEIKNPDPTPQHRDPRPGASRSNPRPARGGR